MSTTKKHVIANCPCGRKAEIREFQSVYRAYVECTRRRTFCWRGRPFSADTQENAIALAIVEWNRRMGGIVDHFAHARKKVGGKKKAPRKSVDLSGEFR